MTEYRKQRLLAKLFDSFGCSDNIYKYYDYIVSKTGPSPAVDGEVLTGLALKSGDPTRFLELSYSLMAQNNAELLGLVQILLKAGQQQCLPEIGQRPVEATASFPGLEAPQPPPNFTANAELDEISKKLNTFHSRAGLQELSRPESVIDNLNVEVVPVKNSVECALSSLPEETREFALIEDLLCLLLGHCGNYLSLEGNVCRVDSSADAALIQTLLPIVKLCVHLRGLDRYGTDCRRNSFERTLGAFSSVIDAFVQEVRGFIVMLERRFGEGGYLLGQLSFYLKPYIEKAVILTGLCHSICAQRLKGGALLRFLETQLAAHSGDAAQRALIEGVLVPSAAPFLDVLDGWLNGGELVDPQGEFMIRANPMVESELEAFAGAPENTPLVLAPLADKVLLIGLYQRILKRCSSSEVTVQRAELMFDRKALTLTVTRAFSFVNQAMGLILGKEEVLLPVLARLKGVYFMDRVHKWIEYMESVEGDLSTPNGVDVEVLNRKLQDSGLIPEDDGMFSASLSSLGLFDQLLGIISGSAKGDSNHGSANGQAALSLEATIDFPMNLVVSRDALAKYQILFRFLFLITRLSHRLSEKRTGKHVPAAAHKPIALLKHTMLHFLGSLQAYTSNQVFSPQYEDLARSIRSSSGLDKIIGLHNNYLDTCLRQSLLTNPKLVQLLAYLLGACERFTLILASLEQTTSALNPADTEAVTGQLGQLEQSFTKSVQVFLEALQYFSARDSDLHLGKLLAQIDYNAYYYSSGAARATTGETRWSGGLAI